MRHLIVLAGLTICAFGCDGSNPSAPSTTTTTTPTPTPVTPSGDNWSLLVESPSAAPNGGRFRSIEGALNTSSETTTGFLSPFGSCFSPERDRIQLTGSRSGNTVQLESHPVNNQVVRITGTLSAAGDVLDATFSITGGCANGASGRILGRRVDWTGVWKGQLSGVPTVFEVRMGTTPDSGGNFEILGTATFSNIDCFQNATIERRGRGRIIFPDVVASGQRLELIVVVSEDLNTMYVDHVLVSGACSPLSFGSGTLFRQ